MRARSVGVADRVDRDGEAVVLVGDQVVRLSALSCAVLALCDDDWAESRAVARALVATFGPPPDGADHEQAVLATFRALRAAGVLELD